MKKVLFFVIMFSFTNVIAQPPKVKKDTTKQVFYWYGKKITRKQYMDSLNLIFIKFTDSMNKTKYVNY